MLLFQLKRSPNIWHAILHYMVHSHWQALHSLPGIPMQQRQQAWKFGYHRSIWIMYSSNLISENSHSLLCRHMGAMASQITSKSQSKEKTKLCVTGLCAGNSPLNSEFPALRVSNAENVSIWWRYHTKLAKRLSNSSTVPFSSISVGSGLPCSSIKVFTALVTNLLLVV